MKKILTLICCTIVLAVTSCKKETIVGPGATTVFTSTKGWAFDPDLGAYTATVPMPEINSYYNNHGAVLVYLVETDTNGAVSYEQLPDVFDGVTYRSVYTGGTLYIDAQNADGSKLNAAPANIDLKVVLVP